METGWVFWRLSEEMLECLKGQRNGESKIISYGCIFLHDSISIKIKMRHWKASQDVCVQLSPCGLTFLSCPHENLKGIGFLVNYDKHRSVLHAWYGNKVDLTVHWSPWFSFQICAFLFKLVLASCGGRTKLPCTSPWCS